jgi:undecaprenyl-diphosphatase
MEQMLFQLLNQQWTHPTLDRAMAVLSDFSVWKPVLAVAALLAAALGGTRGRIWLLLTVALVLFNDNAVSYPLKRLTQRARPYEAQANVRTLSLNHTSGTLKSILLPPTVKSSPAPAQDRPSKGRSFPSSHTFNMVALAWVTYRFAPAIGRWLLPIPVLMAWSRIYTGSHWPGDVAFPLLVGPILNEALLRLLNGIWKSRIARDGTRLHASCPLLIAPPPPSEANPSPQ